MDFDEYIAGLGFSQMEDGRYMAPDGESFLDADQMQQMYGADYQAQAEAAAKAQAEAQRVAQAQAIAQAESQRLAQEQAIADAAKSAEMQRQEEAARAQVEPQAQTQASIGSNDGFQTFHDYSPEQIQAITGFTQTEDGRWMAPDGESFLDTDQITQGLPLNYDADPRIDGAQYRSLTQWGAEPDKAYLKSFGIEPINHPEYGWIAPDDEKYKAAFPDRDSSSIFDFGPIILPALFATAGLATGAFGGGAAGAGALSDAAIADIVAAEGGFSALPSAGMAGTAGITAADVAATAAADDLAAGVTAAKSAADAGLSIQPGILQTIQDLGIPVTDPLVQQIAKQAAGGAIQSAVKGQNPLEGAVMGGALGGLSSGISGLTSGLTPYPVADQMIGSGALSGIVAGATGRDPVEGALSGATSAGIGNVVGGLTNNLTGVPLVDKTIGNAGASAIYSGVMGGDPVQAALGSAISSGLKAGTGMIWNAAKGAWEDATTTETPGALTEAPQSVPENYWNMTAGLGPIQIIGGGLGPGTKFEKLQDAIDAHGPPSGATYPMTNFRVDPVGNIWATDTLPGYDNQEMIIGEIGVAPTGEDRIGSPGVSSEQTNPDANPLAVSVTPESLIDALARTMEVGGGANVPFATPSAGSPPSGVEGGPAAKNPIATGTSYGVTPGGTAAITTPGNTAGALSGIVEDGNEARQQAERQAEIEAEAQRQFQLQRQIESELDRQRSQSTVQPATGLPDIPIEVPADAIAGTSPAIGLPATGSPGGALAGTDTGTPSGTGPLGGLTDGVIGGVPGGTPGDIAGGALGGVSDGIIGGAPGGKPGGIAGGLLDGTPDGIPGGALEGAPSGAGTEPGNLGGIGALPGGITTPTIKPTITPRRPSALLIPTYSRATGGRATATGGALSNTVNINNDYSSSANDFSWLDSLLKSKGSSLSALENKYKTA